MLFANGAATYNYRLETLQSGSMVEQWGAAALAVDPVTQFLADQLAYLMN